MYFLRLRIGEGMKMRTASRKPLRLRELREERGFSQYGLAQQSGVGRSTIAALEAGERGAHPSTKCALARALRVTVPDLYRNRITPPPSHDRLAGTAESYERLRENQGMLSPASSTTPTSNGWLSSSWWSWGGCKREPSRWSSPSPPALRFRRMIY